MITLSPTTYIVQNHEEYEALVASMFPDRAYEKLPNKFPAVVTPILGSSLVEANYVDGWFMYNALTGGAPLVDKCYIEDGIVRWEKARLYTLKDGDVYRVSETEPEIFRVVRHQRTIGRDDVFVERLLNASPEYLKELPAVDSLTTYTACITYNEN